MSTHGTCRWPSIAAFLGGVPADGLHAIRLGATELRLSLHNAPLESRYAVLPVLFPGALGGRETSPGSAALDRSDRPWPAIRIADPARTLDEGLPESWYIGTASAPLQPLLNELLQRIAERTGKELLLVGGCGGGFAALRHAHALGSSASALVWNPHTDWLECQEAVVRRFLAQAFPDITLPEEGGPTFRDAMAAALHTRGVVHALPGLAQAGPSPRRLLYLQGASDPELARQAAPYMEAAGFDAMEDGFATTGQDALLWFGSWGPGRTPPPAELLALAVEHLMERDRSACGFRTTIQRHGYGQYVKPALVPRDLRKSQLPLKVSAMMDAGQMRVQAQLGELAEGDGQVAYAFYVHAGRERVATRWYEAGQTFRYHDDPTRPATRVTAFVRDGLGHLLQSRDVAVSHTEPGRRVIIFGSCVSRDAFALAEHELTLAAYIARSSIASAFDSRKPSTGVKHYLPQIESAFQRKAVSRDFARSASALLRATPCEIVLLDLIDERFALLDMDGALVTISNELRKTGFPMAGRIVAPGSPEHLQAWSQGLDRFLAALGHRPLVVNRVRWASHDNHGAPLPDQPRTLRANTMLDQMYARLAKVPEVRFIDYPDALLVADREHKWGVSPFHYIRGMYDHTMAELTRLLLHTQGTVSVSSHHPSEAK